MWRKQPEAKPSSPVTPTTRDSAYAPPSQKPAFPSGSLPASPPQPLFTQTPSSDAAILTRGICIKGELTGRADLLIDGDVQGSIRLGDSRLTVGQSGHVQADIEASEILVHGRVEGDLRGRERVSLGSSCHVVGDLEAPRIAIEDGARFNGRVEMGPAADAYERQNKRNSQPFISRKPSSVETETISPVALETQRSSH
ncbi:MAG: polymer-forming cytoskeletal protein [Candidatus Acidiferrales bacterium]